MIDFQQALNRLWDSLDAGDDSAFSNLLVELDIALIGCNEWPDSFFDGLLALLEDEKFFALEESWNLLYFVSNNWRALSAEQRERLRPSLAASMDKCQDWLGAFAAAEILGERYADDTALAVLRSLSRAAEPPVRPLVSHGLVYLVRATTDEHTRASAVELLRDLRGNRIEEVRADPITALRELEIEI